MVVDGLIGGGFDGLIGSEFDGFDMGSRWCWVRLRLVMGLICVCWVDPFDRLLGLIFFHMGLIHIVLVSLF